MKNNKTVAEMIWSKTEVNSCNVTIEWRLTRYSVIGCCSGTVIETTYTLDKYMDGSFSGNRLYKQEWRMIKHMKEIGLIEAKEW